MKKSSLLLLSALTLIGLPLQAVAEVSSFTRQEEDSLLAVYGQEEIISIATGSQKALHRAPSVATVITAEEIRESGARTLDQVLERVPGLHVGRSAVSRQDAVYSIRGIHTGFNPQVLLLMDGVAFPHLYSGGRPSTFSLPVENIERVEVIRGPGSAVYGADAFAGVINIITRGPSRLPATRMGLEAGSFDTTDVWFQSGGTLGGVAAVFSMEWSKSNGDTGRRIDADLQTTLDNAFGTRLSSAPGPLETGYNMVNTHLQLSKDRWTFRGWAWLQNEAGLGPGGAQALDPVGRQDVTLWLGDLEYHLPALLSSLDATVRLSHFYSKDDSYFQLLPSGLIGNPASYDHQTTLELTGLYSGIQNHKFRVGAGGKYSHEETGEHKNFGPGVTPGVLTDVTGTDFVYMKPHSRDVYFLSLQDEWQFAEDWELTGGVRVDRYSDFGVTLNPRVALVWATRHDLTSRLMYGRAFRAPAFSELYAINNPVVLGNPDLQPEIIHTYELAFDYRPSLRWRTAFNVFYYQIRGLINFVPDSNGVSSTAQNVDDQNGYGFEWESSWQASKELRLMGNLAYNRAEHDLTGAPVADAPAKHLFLNGQWEFHPDWLLGPTVNWVMDRSRANGDNRPAVNDFILVDVALRRKNIAKNLDATLMVQNIFDSDAREPAGRSIPHDYPLEGLGVFARLSYQFDK